jgi:hypothetical protein
VTSLTLYFKRIERGERRERERQREHKGESSSTGWKN